MLQTERKKVKINKSICLVFRDICNAHHSENIFNKI